MKCFPTCFPTAKTHDKYFLDTQIHFLSGGCDTLYKVNQMRVAMNGCVYCGFFWIYPMGWK
jgi:hypothetical protein